ncbi:MAG: sigma-70 family RNA polymerase sigma factor [Lysinibacillus sp.]
MKMKEIQNPILRAFLANKEHLELYRQYNQSPQEHIKVKIDERFLDFYSQIRAVSYFSKTIHFTALHYDKKRRLFDHRNVLFLDRPAYEGGEAGGNGSISLKELIEDEAASKMFEEEMERELGDYIQNPILHDAILALNERQKQLLYLSFVKEMTDTEIGRWLHVSQQAITKSKNNALKKVRRMIDARL